MGWAWRILEEENGARCSGHLPTVVRNTFRVMSRGNVLFTTLCRRFLILFWLLYDFKKATVVPVFYYEILRKNNEAGTKLS